MRVDFPAERRPTTATRRGCRSLSPTPRAAAASRGSAFAEALSASSMTASVSGQTALSLAKPITPVRLFPSIPIGQGRCPEQNGVPAADDEGTGQALIL
jgi:hypothetical protein